MKFILFAFIVMSAFTLSLGNEFITFTSNSMAEFILNIQFQKKAAELIDWLNECNQTWSATEDESIELFKNPPPHVIRFTTKPAKCLMDCVMRKSGVVCKMEDIELAHTLPIRMMCAITRSDASFDSIADDR